MNINVKVSFAPEIEPAKPTFVCMACCEHMLLVPCDNGCCIQTCCYRHPSTLIRDGKVIGTSA